MSDTTFSARASAMQIPSLPPGVTLTTLDNGLVIIVRRSPFHGTVASRNHRVTMTL
jgi:predicted Zn-dependent peptidase